MKVAKLGTVDASRDEMFPIDFLLTLSKIKGKLQIFTLSVVYSISYDLLLDCYQTYYIALELFACVLTKFGSLVTTIEGIIHCI